MEWVVSDPVNDSPPANSLMAFFRNDPVKDNPAPSCLFVCLVKEADVFSPAS